LIRNYQTEANFKVTGQERRKKILTSMPTNPAGPSSASTIAEPSTSWAESLLAQDLNKLSLDDREKALEDLHGVSADINETPELVASRLYNLDRALFNNETYAAYDLAKSQNVKYTSSMELRLKFLRAARFDPARAATRLVGFLERKMELFGRNTLARELLFTDLDEEERRCLESGLMTMLPVRDRSGRCILTWMPMLRAEFTPLAKVRFALSSEGEWLATRGS
jgi:hypothetical protein